MVGAQHSDEEARRLRFERVILSDGPATSFVLFVTEAGSLLHFLGEQAAENDSLPANVQSCVSVGSPTVIHEGIIEKISLHSNSSWEVSSSVAGDLTWVKPISSAG